MCIRHTKVSVQKTVFRLRHQAVVVAAVMSSLPYSMLLIQQGGSQKLSLLVLIVIFHLYGLQRKTVCLQVMVTSAFQLMMSLEQLIKFLRETCLSILPHTLQQVQTR